MDAKGLVLMSKENGILVHELGSYEIEAGLELIFKAYVEGDCVNLFLTTDRDVNDEEYNQIFDDYDEEWFLENGYKIEEVENEYNPVWHVKFDFKGNHLEMQETLNLILQYHSNEMKRISEEA